MNKFKTFISAILAGISISLGGTIFLSLDDKVIGSFLFAVGLFCVCTGGLHLFTGKVCYACFNDRDYAISLPIIWLGNLVGAFITATVIGLSRIGNISEKASQMCEVKGNDSLLSLFVLGIFCNVFIFIAVEGYKTIPDAGKYLAIIFGVMGFILCGTEHCVADMFYVSVAKAWSFDFLIRIIVITAGNSLGGIAAACLLKLKNDK